MISKTMNAFASGRSALAVQLLFMKNKSRFVALATGFAALSLAATASAQIYALDDPAGYSSGAGNSAWLSGVNATNGGFGFTPWVFTRGGPALPSFLLCKCGGKDGRPLQLRAGGGGRGDPRRASSRCVNGL